MTRKSTNGHTNGRPRTNGHEAAKPPGFDNLVELNRTAFKTIDEMNQCVAEGFEAYRQASLKFAERRIRRGFAIPHTLLNCWTPQEAFSVYMDFVQSTQKDYIAEADRLTQLGQSLADASLQAVDIEIPVSTSFAADARASRAPGD